MDIATIDAALSASGLTLLGAFHPEPDDGVPGLEPDGPAGASLILAGNAGPAMWQAFAKQRHPDDGPDPLDHWSRRTLESIASKLSREFDVPVTTLFPFDGPPYHAFQRWAKKSSQVHPSPFGPMVHHRYGLWHAYRGALVIPQRLDLPPPNPSLSPCDACADKPCLTACPVGAFDGAGYDVPACVGHLAGERGDDCFRRGCLARAACPVGAAYAYEEDQARFHLDRFFASHRRSVHV